ncbi:acetyl-CoA carboxylase biotin carboxyl carrier protein [Candidatus Margulisiibacteriota bacterium]
MDLELIKKLIKMAEESDISGLAVEEGGFKVEVKRDRGQIVVPASQPAVHSIPVPTAPAHTPAAVEASDEEGMLAIISPMVGTFYRSPSPESPSYANVGDEVSPGKVVCIIEAMKLFNEIESEVQGTVAKILVENGQPVEYGQKLFLIRK